MSKQGLPIVQVTETACCAPLASEPLDSGEAELLAPLFKAIADPVRLRLLSLIACHEGGEACVCDLTAAFDLTAPTISHHLKVLKQAGLIDSERRGTWVYYWLNPSTLERLSAVLGPRGLTLQPVRVQAGATGVSATGWSPIPVASGR